MPEPKHRSFAILTDEDDIGKRLDTFVTSAFPELSRNLAAKLIRNGEITIGGTKKKPAYRINDGDMVEGIIHKIPAADLQPEPVDIDIIFEDNELLVINKKPGIVVHPAPGHEHGTIAHGLIFHRPRIKNVGSTPNRPGIVHRLDKDTSGILIIAKTQTSYDYLVSQFKARAVRKKYLGIVYGVPESESGSILLKIGRHATHRKKMAVVENETARSAETHWYRRDAFNRLALLEFDIKTGRTHQIRVHCASIHHPIVGDQTYGLKKPEKLFKDNPELKKIISTVPRHMLHAWQLSLKHPETGEILKFEVPLPDDMRLLIEAVRGL